MQDDSELFGGCLWFETSCLSGDCEHLAERYIRAVGVIVTLPGGIPVCAVRSLDWVKRVSIRPGDLGTVIRP